ncbi:hypothetical protein [Aeromicrobium marinum]|uniref:hypothetical protein n=1 Tax=Aeromicrobium marinum TaxID=219314 RepID=UPI00068176A2|nr:hypothetical protein [Aeromicrobium marinum]
MSTTDEGTRTAGARPARRLQLRRWRDPRLLAGVLVLLTTTTVGARWVATSDDTVQYWMLADAVTAGDPVQRADLVATSVRWSDSTAEGYLAVDDDLPAALGSLRWTRDGRAGDLLDRAAVQVGGDRTTREVPLNVTVGAFPPGLARGQLVDVWVGPGPGDDSVEPAVLVLDGVRVLQAGEPSSSVGTELSRTVVVDAGDAGVDGGQVARLASGHVTVVGVP